MYIREYCLMDPRLLSKDPRIAQLLGMQLFHEVEVIASVRHVNLVSLQGYCTATVPLEGHQRIIVSDFMPN